MANEVHLIGQNVLNPPPADRWFVDYLPLNGGDELTYYVDGESYATDLHAALTGATQEICLTGLHFSGHFHLKRPGGCDPLKQDDPDTLQEILAARSKAGCEIYLLVNQFWPDEGEIAADYWRAYRDLDKLLWKMPHAIARHDHGLGRDSRLPGEDVRLLRVPQATTATRRRSTATPTSTRATSSTATTRRRSSWTAISPSGAAST